MEQMTEGRRIIRGDNDPVELPYLRYQFDLPAYSWRRCETPGCTARGRKQVRVGTSQEPGRVEILCMPHFEALVGLEQTAMLAPQ